MNNPIPFVHLQPPVTAPCHSASRRTPVRMIEVLAVTFALLFTSCTAVQRGGGHAGTTRVTVTGSADCTISGYYVQDGRRVAVSSAVPWSLDLARLSRLDLVKAPASAKLNIELRYSDRDQESQITKILESGVTRIRVKVQHGLVVTTE